MPHTNPDDPNSASTGYNNSSSTAGQVAQNSIFERIARAGFVGSGIVHLIIGYIAIRLALGGGGGTADQSGAMTELANKPGGGLALWIGVVVFAAMGLWRVVEGVLGSSSRPDANKKLSRIFDRIKAFSLAAVYFAFAFTSWGFARGIGKSSSSQSTGITARLMQSGVGSVALVVGALVIVAIGGYHVYKGASQNFLDDLDGPTSDLVRRLGTVGYIAKGLAIAAVGVLVIVAVIQSAPDKSSGLDGALKTLGAQPYGVALLVAAGLGIITYGLYSFAMARSAKM
ncbi:DUF1206 domain-containing protein [Rhodococcus sp. IEGM 1366]|uniref:DUF1206 domain-containing protein n=1 Tax=unclassified Rhodococcus (in: high G+C Gram-positive bacteria) TaxID=192944 RepID=UPI000E2856DF|nr:MULTISPECIES: DUF1206 domain-containing protein [unclassified Rhodococcus (in: high G+C Gram-positive bacteria)]MDV8068084.1 DUF1206 domain-containing protein [Rhodococcus sp. IEGM 1366]ROZ45606.1 DUF1206 domain-containing protein [Rhodococcus sp. WS3]